MSFLQSYRLVLLGALSCAFGTTAAGDAPPPRVMERLGRGVVAMETPQGVFLSWRVLGTDRADASFDIYRNGEKVTPVPISGASNHVDVAGKIADRYRIEVLEGGKPVGRSREVGVWPARIASANKGEPPLAYLEVPLDPPGPKYVPGDMSVGDLDGDGEFDLVFEWEGSSPWLEAVTLAIDSYSRHDYRLLLLFAALVAQVPTAQASDTRKASADDNRQVNPAAGPVFAKNVARPLRYRPNGTDFVIENGAESFNRPLYSNNTAFRVDAGDQPEFGLYLPGRGGNLRLGIHVGGEAKWLQDAKSVVARYRSGSMVYEIRDPLLGAGVLRVTALNLADANGLIVRSELEGAEDVALLAAFGGVDGAKGARAVDIGAEAVPVSEWWRFQPEHCRGNQITLDGASFTLKAKAGAIGGFFSAGTTLSLGDAADWDRPGALLASAKPGCPLPVVFARSPLAAKSPVYVVLKPLAENRAADTGAPDFAAWFDAAETRRRAIAETIVADTPDAFINAAASALCFAADGIWEEKPGVWMHGAVAWRGRYLGWRGPYAGDALGWHARSLRHLSWWAGRQFTTPAEVPVQADEEWNLARSQSSLMFRGMFPKTGGAAYDMNLVYIDALFRHLLWTGDLGFAKEVWPVVERHFAWEQRLFRRQFTGRNGEKLPTYENYCAIWASDDLWYAGGGTSHASAYNYYHNKVAARIAKLLGKDATPYEREAGLIARGMREHLWLPGRGWFAESKDLLGLQRTHDHPFLATFYHTIDCEVPTAHEAARMMRYVDTELAHIPIKGPGVPADREYFTVPTSNWMPYSWSTNNVAMAESAHAALAYWQAGREETGFTLFKGALLDSMFMGLCPGNLGMTTQFDMGTGERYRDFGDAVGIVARTLVEGLFGLKPDALSGELTVRPGFPADWGHASLKHPSVDLAFKRDGLTETYTIRPKFAKPMALRLEAAALRDGVTGVTVDGRPAKWEFDRTNGGRRVHVAVPANGTHEVAIRWQGGEIPPPALPPVQPVAKCQGHEIDWTVPLRANTEPVGIDAAFNDKVSQIFRNDYGSPRSPFASLALPKHGYGSWCYPRETFEVDDSGLRAAAARGGGRISLPNGLAFLTPGTADAKNVAFVSLWDNYPDELSIPLSGRASRVFLLATGSTNSMQSHCDNAEVVVTYADGTTARLPLHNPTTWWPIDQDYVIDDYAFRYQGAIPPRVDLKTGRIRFPQRGDLSRGPNLMVAGGAATVLNLPLDPAKPLQSLTVRALANEVVVGLISVTLAR